MIRVFTIIHYICPHSKKNQKILKYFTILYFSSIMEETSYCKN